MKKKFTPGPWFIDGNNTTNVIADVKEESRTSILHICGCRLGFNYGQHLETDRANARLIAAAPEMFDTLEKIVETCEVNPQAIKNLLKRITAQPFNRASR